MISINRVKAHPPPPRTPFTATVFIVARSKAVLLLQFLFLYLLILVSFIYSVFDEVLFDAVISVN